MNRKKDLGGMQDGRGLNVDLVRDLAFSVFDSLSDSYLKPRHE